MNGKEFDGFDVFTHKSSGLHEIFVSVSVCANKSPHNYKLTPGSPTFMFMKANQSDL